MKTFWRVDELKVVRDPTKEEVREKFDWVKKKIKDFNENKSEEEVLAVVVRWMGWDVELGRKNEILEREIRTKKTQPQNSIVDKRSKTNNKNSKKKAKQTEKVRVEKIDKVPIDGPSYEVEFNDKSYKFDRYGLLNDGTAISVDSYCLWLANEQSTFVVLLQDMDIYGEVKPENINWDNPFNELSSQEKLLTEESHKALENFIQFHATHQEFKEDSKYWEILEQPVILVPDAMSFLSKEN